MLTHGQLLALTPPEGLSDEDLHLWWQNQLCEPDGTLILGDEWAKEEPKPAAE